MRHFTFAQMRRHSGRLVAALLAIVISTGFAAAALIGVDTAVRTIRNAFVIGMGQADLVAGIVMNNQAATLPTKAASYISQVPGVEVVQPTNREYGTLLTDGGASQTRGQSVGIAPTASDARLNAYPVNPDWVPVPALDAPLSTTGREPAGLSEIAVGKSVAQALRLCVAGLDQAPDAAPCRGNQVELLWDRYVWAVESDDSQTAAAFAKEIQPLLEAIPNGITGEYVNSDTGIRLRTKLTVTGIFDDTRPSFDVSGNVGAVGLDAIAEADTALNAAASNAYQISNTGPGDTVLVAFETEADSASTRQGVDDALRAAQIAQEREDLERQRAEELRYQEEAIARGEEADPSSDWPDGPITDEYASQYLQDSFDDLWRPQPRTMTKTEAADLMTERYLGSTAIMTGVLLIFAVVAMVVAGLVIANTFQVLVAQRTRTLALLRCIGASRRQIRRSVLLEAAATGLFGGLAGLALGAGLIQLALMLVRSLFPRVPTPASINLPILAIVIPVASGLIVTVLSALVPSRLATHVAPVAALRPQTNPTLKLSSGKARLVLSLFGGIGGAVGMALCLFAIKAMAPSSTGLDYIYAEASSITTVVVLGCISGVICAVGVIIGTPLWVPKVVSAMAGLAGRLGPGPRLAAANTVRNPRRTAATATALLIGVTLVTAVSAGAACIETSLEKSLEARSPFDLEAGSSWAWNYIGGSVNQDGHEINYVYPSAFSITPLPQGLGPSLATIDGIKAVLSVLGTEGTVVNPRRQPCPNGSYYDPCPAQDEWDTTISHSGSEGQDQTLSGGVLIGGVDPTGLESGFPALSRAAAALAKGQAIMGATGAAAMGITEGETLTVTIGSIRHEYAIHVVKGSYLDIASLLIPQADLLAAAPQAQAFVVWGTIDPKADAVEVVTQAKDLAATYVDAQGNATRFYGGAVDRQENRNVVRTVLLVLMALLAIAVVIALVGVANTLSLSVIERTREHGLLRALGLTRRQMRHMLALEGTLIAGTGALLGLILGTGFGWSATYMLLALTDRSALAIYPWHLVGIMVIALLAGLIASAAPGRRAARTQPAVALGAE